MSLFRIVILAVLFYLLYRVLTGKSSKSVKDKKAPSGQVSHDTLMEDPVCHTYIPKGQAVTLKKKGETYFFCSEECRRKFEQQ